ncbi:FHA domain-containing protein [candidate division KSB1 bacterium]|nr:FHA domain-containing protein [candidate division KSB1 bacterium]
MRIINVIDSAIKNVIYSMFWWFIDPLEFERLCSQLIDVLERHLDANDPERLVAPDHFQVFVNNAVFIKHAHSIKKLEVSVRDRLQKYVANKDYELAQPKIDIQIISSATVSKRKADIHCWFSFEEDEGLESNSPKKFTLKVISGEGKGLSWILQPGNTYSIGRLSTCDICLPFKNISKKQVLLNFQSEEKINIIDEKSTNGTFINDEKEPCKGKRNLRLTDNIRFCRLDPIILTLTAE